MSRPNPEETRSTEPSTLYPDEGEIARVLMPRNVKAWPGLAVVLEREGLPKIDPQFGGRYWPAVRDFLDRRENRRQSYDTARSRESRYGRLASPRTQAHEAPQRANGPVGVADEKLVARGYQPKTVRLFGEWPSPEVAKRCRVLQAEMLEWAAGLEPHYNARPEGTVEWLARAFERDEESPFHPLRQDTRKFYSRYIDMILGTVDGKQPGGRETRVGALYLADITGRCVRRWHATWREKHGPRSAYAGVQTLRRVVAYGCELRERDALELAQVLSETSFSMPKGRKVRPSYEQTVAFRKAAHEEGRPSIAIAVTIQFDLGLRQKDVIGEWVKAGDGSREGIMDGAFRWEWGLAWNHISSALLLQKPTSKSNGHEIAEHDLNLYPDIVAELASIPAERRVGPVNLDERSGKPWRASHFSRQFRKIARKAGWPDNLRNMDTRAGAISESFDAGADATDIMRGVGTHTQLSTTMGYQRGNVVQSSRVAELRAKRRRETA